MGATKMQADTEARLAPGDHVVVFYRADEDLALNVVGYLAAALLEGDTAVVVARARNAEAFKQGLRRVGIDVEAAQATDRLSVLDAAETLAKFVVEGLPDPAAFEAAVGSVVRHAVSSGRPVRVYGEMVDLLWDEGHVVGALELEKLWNGLAEDIPFSLFCAYSGAMMARLETGTGFAQVCNLHSDVIGGGPCLEEAEISRRFPQAPHGPRQARLFVAETLQAWDRCELIDDATLVVGELAMNAVTHAASGFSVSLARAGQAVTIAVGDRDVTAPVRRRYSSTSPGGRGLHLVEAVASSWGHTVVPTGKLVWATLAGGK
jgi:anti-sigma regulatory factor (Ser/Thr protein kinase)